MLCYSHIDGSYNQAEKSLHPKDLQQIANVKYINSQIITKLQILQSTSSPSVTDQPYFATSEPINMAAEAVPVAGLVSTRLEV